MKKEVEEQYLKAILFLGEREEPVKTTELAKYLGLSPATITEGLQKLAREKLINYEAYQGASLTPNGRSVATKVRRKHRLLERFLTDMLGLQPDSVHEQACSMEHSLSDEAEVALCRILNHPDMCPDDSQAIPPCDLDVESCVQCKETPVHEMRSSEAGELIPLTSLKKGARGKIQLIRGGRNAVSKLQNMGLCKGTEIQMLSCAPLSGPVEVCVRGCKIALGRGIATKIFVC